MRISRRTAVITHDLFMIALAWELAWLARFNFSLPALDYWWANLRALPVVLVIQGALALRFGLYRGMWRFASVPDLINIGKAVLLGAFAIMLALFFITRLADVPRSLLILYPLFLMFLLGGPRLAYRLWKDHEFNLGNLRGGLRVIIVGAGRAGEAVARDMLRSSDYSPVGFIDDKQRFRNSRIHGLPVLGAVAELEAVAEEVKPDFILIAIPSASNKQMRRMVAACEASGVRFRTLPKLKDLTPGASYLSEVRDVSIEDLLGRDKVELDWNLISQGLAAKTVMVTGGGGSIGSELCRQLARIGPQKLIIVEQSEFNLFSIERELRETYPRLDLMVCLGDVCESTTIESVVTQTKPDIVFHAAAYKHVSMLQSNVREAVRNNILGTQRVAEASARAGCAEFVLISTDKAVNPTSVMGLTKRVAEMLCVSMNTTSATRFVTVRFGNVLGSTGSVVPIFQQQIAAGGPVTVTHEAVSRFFMTIPEASQLIMQAAVMGVGGEVFVLEMGEPIKIAYMAEQMILLSGKEPGHDIEIQFTGLRAGEKLHEELFHVEEDSTATSHGKIRLALHRKGDLGKFETLLAALTDACEVGDEDALISVLRKLVPEYNSKTVDESTAEVIPFVSEAGSSKQ